MTCEPDTVTSSTVGAGEEGHEGGGVRVGGPLPLCHRRTPGLSGP